MTAVVPVMKACEHCGAAFEQATGRGRPRRFCSGPCKERARYEATARHGLTEVRNCDRCGRTFDRMQRPRATRFCSDACMHRHNEERREALELAAFVEDVPLQFLVERDGGRCRLCGEPVALEEQVPHLLAPTVDHIVPLSRGGMHSKANTQLAHFACNARKWASDQGEGVSG